MKKLLLFSLSLCFGLIYTNIAQAEEGIIVARATAKVLTHVKGETSRSSSGSSTSVGSGSGESSNLGTHTGSTVSRSSDLKTSAPYYGSETKDKVEFQKIKPHPKRHACAELWNAYYEKEDIDIKVSTRGNYEEQVLFFCSTCTDPEHFVKPFIESEYEGVTGMDRIKSCGYDFAVFKGGRGFNEVVVEVPKDSM